MTIRIAMAQMEIARHDVAANQAAATALAVDAASQDAQLIVYPELCLTGPIENAVALIDGVGAHVEFWQRLAADAGITIVTGSSITGTAETRHNRTHLVAADGTVLGHHDKRRPWRSELPHTVSGETVTVADAGFGTIGLGICWDITDPAQAAALAEHGAQIAVYPSYWCRQIRGDEVKHNVAAEATHVDALCTARAFENSLCIVFCNASGACVPSDPAEPKRLLGRSQVAMPFLGAVIKASDQPALAIADVDLAVLDDARALYGTGAATRNPR